MTIKEKLNSLEELLDIEKDTLEEETELENIEQWDSMAAITVIAMFDSDFGKDILPAEVKAFKKVKDITDLME